ncbi:MAG: xanthine dehydrogenase family protein molybdopterin-binding subunit [Syntrophorhabdus sp.]
MVGSNRKRIDVIDKVLGRPVFAGDMTIDKIHYVVIYRSPRPHARIRSIDASVAAAQPGIAKVISAADIPGQKRFGVIKKDQPCLAEDRVRYVGEPILLIVGKTEDAARKAMGLVKIDFEDIETIRDPFTAEKSTTLIHNDGNLLGHRKVIKGNVEKGFAESDVIVEHTYGTTWLDHGFMETEAGVGYLDEAGRVVVTSSTQNIHYKMKEISRVLGIPEDRVRVVQSTTGGGFGGKLDVTVELFLALAVYHTKKPVMMRFTREESFLSNTKRHPLYIEYKTGARKDGSIQAIRVNIIGDTGPYISYGETVCLRVAVHSTGPYEVPNVYTDSRMFYTNNPVCGAMRGFGVPQLAFAHESQMDEIARALDIDPLDIRLKNGLRKGSITATSQILYDSVGFIDTLRKIEPFWRARKKSSHTSGFGIGCMFYGCGNTGISNPARCHLRITDNGKIALHSGVCEIGQGSDTILWQILLETLKIDEKNVVLVRGDTDTSSDVGSTSASRQTYISGRAVYEAASKLYLYLDEKGYYRGRSLGDIYKEAKAENNLVFDGYFDPPTTKLNMETSEGIPYATYAFATHMTEVEIDEKTGSCSVKKVHAAHDVGKAVNPGLVKGQVYGGVAMGIGFALMEEFIPGKSESFDNYYMPTSMDMPDVEVFIVEDEEPTGPFGAKGVGEPALIPQAASIMNAIQDAVYVRPYQLPCHIERLKKLIEDKKNQRR